MGDGITEFALSYCKRHCCLELLVNGIAQTKEGQSAKSFFLHGFNRKTKALVGFTPRTEPGLSTGDTHSTSTNWDQECLSHKMQGMNVQLPLLLVLTSKTVLLDYSQICYGPVVLQKCVVFHKLLVFCK